MKQKRNFLYHDKIKEDCDVTENFSMVGKYGISKPELL
jgi:hypothetical protein